MLRTLLLAVFALTAARAAAFPVLIDCGFGGSSYTGELQLPTALDAWRLRQLSANTWGYSVPAVTLTFDGMTYAIDLGQIDLHGQNMGRTFWTAAAVPATLADFTNGPNGDAGSLHFVGKSDALSNGAAITTLFMDGKFYSMLVPYEGATCNLRAAPSF